MILEVRTVPDKRVRIADVVQGVVVVLFDNVAHHSLASHELGIC